ncbi:flagellar assembly peptidoglycan hydrolase FlgJ [Erwinia pyrifoliae]|uniref:flagellar assembly peptidoglycan hydrolase FlgJ n=1 Tax=Erwinia pyrifoliae TaxID=79967 RepID=UPI00223B9560|nr:flagellar assembly peptidoglycan hydrolase FlgJ [Erwinia pyrifoliae]MCT2386365.1 flagellar assembly peptidoglycan hydrolase FlgJ [Erwinia pyrifoliae]MCU8588038.1 flagellar assembly peptidoglycan hydrolase FlgJ [Erwinia pyrifoliae]
MSATQPFSTAAWDLRSLDALKLKATNNAPQALKAAAQQMEGLFVQMMLKSMRDASIKDDALHSPATDMYTSMHDQQLAQDIAQKSQLGFAGMIVRQMGGESASPSANIAAPAAASWSSLPDGLRPPSAKTAAVPPSSPVAMSTSSPTNLACAQGSSSQPFIQRLLRPALQAAQSSGIHPHLILAQAALESGWGKREIAASDGKPSHNLFGIKASADWQGKTTEITTTEYRDGSPHKVKAAFRVYDSYSDALTDYARLLTNNPRYRHVAQSTSAEQGAHALQAGGYATDPAYASKLKNIIQQVKGSISTGIQAYKNDLNDLF